MREVTWDWACTPSHGCSLPPIDRENGQFRRQVLAWLEDVEKHPGVEGVIFFQNVALDSSHLGESTAVMYGPGCTYTAARVEEMKADPMKYFLGDLPSVRMYPQWYVTRAGHLTERAAGRAQLGRDEPDDPGPPPTPYLPNGEPVKLTKKLPGLPLASGDAARKVAAWLTGLERNGAKACRDVVPVLVRVLYGQGRPEEVYAGARYADDLCADRLYLIGRPPAYYARKVRDCGLWISKYRYRVDGVAADWYVSGYIEEIKPEFAAYHPFGANFYLDREREDKPLAARADHPQARRVRIIVTPVPEEPRKRGQTTTQVP